MIKSSANVIRKKIDVDGQFVYSPSIITFSLWETNGAELDKIPAKWGLGIDKETNLPVSGVSDKNNDFSFNLDGTTGKNYIFVKAIIDGKEIDSERIEILTEEQNLTISLTNDNIVIPYTMEKNENGEDIPNYDVDNASTSIKVYYGLDEVTATLNAWKNNSDENKIASIKNNTISISSEDAENLDQIIIEATFARKTVRKICKVSRVLNGRNGEDGRSVTINSVEYAVTDAKAEIPSSITDWVKTYPTDIQKGKYLYTKTTFSNGTEIYTESYQGTDGSPGASAVYNYLLAPANVITKEGSSYSQSYITFSSYNSEGAETSPKSVYWEIFIDGELIEELAFDPAESQTLILNGDSENKISPLNNIKAKIYEIREDNSKGNFIDEEIVEILNNEKNLIISLTNDNIVIPQNYDNGSLVPDIRNANTTYTIYYGLEDVTSSAEVEVNGVPSAQQKIQIQQDNIPELITISASYKGTSATKICKVTLINDGRDGYIGADATYYSVESSSKVIRRVRNNSTGSASYVCSPNKINFISYKTIGEEKTTNPVYWKYGIGTGENMRWAFEGEAKLFSEKYSIDNLTGQIKDSSEKIRIEIYNAEDIQLDAEEIEILKDEKELTMTLTNDRITVPCDYNGNNVNYTNANTSYFVYYGLNQVSEATINISNKTNVEVVENDNLISIAEINSDYGEFTISATYAGLTVSKKCEVVKNRATRSISEVNNYYGTSKTQDGEIDWKNQPNDIPSISKEDPFLWNYEEITYTSGGSYTTTPAIIGTYSEDGQDGVGIQDIIEYYYVNNDKNGGHPEVGDSQWSTTPDQLSSSNRFLWNYEKIIYTSITNGTNDSKTTTPCIIGSYGDTAYTWIVYADDNQGTNINISPTDTSAYWGIAYNQAVPDPNIDDYTIYDWSLFQGAKIMAVDYLVTNSSNQPADNQNWSPTVPQVSPGEYLWTRTTFSDGEKNYIVYRQPENGINSEYCYLVSPENVIYATSVQQAITIDNIKTLWDYSSDAITLYSKKSSGSIIENNFVYWKIEYKNSQGDLVEEFKNVQSTEYTFYLASEQPTSYIKFSIYSDAECNNLIDSERIDIITKDSGLVLALSNDSISFPKDKDGNVDDSWYNNATIELETYYNGALIQNDDDKLFYSFVKDSGITIDTTTKGILKITNFDKNINEANVYITAKYYLKDGKYITSSKKVKLFKIMEGKNGDPGAPGSPAVYSYISSPTSVIIKTLVDNGGEKSYTYSPAELTFNAYTVTGSSTSPLPVYWFYKKDNASSNIPFDYVEGGSSSCNLNISNLKPESKITIEARQNSSNTSKLIDSEIIEVISNESELTVVLTNDRVNIPCSADGTYSESLENTLLTSVQVYFGVDDVTKKAKISLGEQNDIACYIGTETGKENNFYFNSISSDRAYFDIIVKYAGKEITKRCEVVKVKQGEPGKIGSTLYTWIKYAEDANGTGMSNQPSASTKYIGIAYNKDKSQSDAFEESNNPEKYNWSLLGGEDGQTLYTWIAYINVNSEGYYDISTISHSPEGRQYIGIASNQLTQEWTDADISNADEFLEKFTWGKYSNIINENLLKSSRFFWKKPDLIVGTSFDSEDFWIIPDEYNPDFLTKENDYAYLTFIDNITYSEHEILSPVIEIQNSEDLKKIIFSCEGKIQNQDNNWSPLEIIFSYKEGEEDFQELTEFSTPIDSQNWKRVFKKFSELNLNIEANFPIFLRFKISSDCSRSPVQNKKYFRKFKIEIGDYATEWLENPLDSNYQSDVLKYIEDVEENLRNSLEENSGQITQIFNFTDSIESDLKDAIDLIGKINGNYEELNSIVLQNGEKVTALDQRIYFYSGSSTEVGDKQYLQISTTPIKIDNSGNIISYGGTVMRLFDDKLSFYIFNPQTNEEEEIAYFSNKKLFVSSIELKDEFSIGRDNYGFLTWKTLNEGIGLIWKNN